MKRYAVIFFCIMSSRIFAVPVITISGMVNPSCNGICDGTISINVSGTGPFAFAWSGLPAETTSTVVNLCAGIYTVVVTDSSDMSADSVTLSLTDPPVLSLTSGPDDTISCGSPAVLSGTGSGGTPPYTYVWTGMPGGPASISVNPVFTTSYTLTISDGNGCIATGLQTVHVTPIMVVTATTTNLITCGYASGTGTLSVVGGTPPYYYFWQMFSGTSPYFGGLAMGTYMVSVQDANGCSGSTNAIVRGPGNMADFTMVADSANPLNYWAFNGNADTSVNYNWQFGDGSASTALSPVHTYAAAGTYTVTLFTDPCRDTMQRTINVAAVPGPCDALFNIGDNVSSYDPNAYTVTNLSYGATLSYLWDFGDGSSSTAQDPAHSYATSTGPYQICLTVNNGSGCTSTFCDSIFSADSISRSLNPISFTVVEGPEFGVATGIAENNSNSSVDVFPNPFSESTTFMIYSDRLNETYSFKLKDVLGKTVRSIKTNEKQFTVSRNGLENGMYFYTITNSHEVVGVGKVIIK